MIAVAAALDQRTLDLLRAHDPVVQRYRAFFARLDWSVLGDPAPCRPRPGRTPHPPSAYIKALLVKVCEGKEYITRLRTFLVEHPLVVLELGFLPVPDPTQLYGFDVERTVPGGRWLRHIQQHLDPQVLRALLSRTVRDLQREIPGLGETVAFDVTHIYAWVEHNNPTAYVAHRYDAAHQPPGDPDCRLGVKTRGNQTRANGTVAETVESLWGYGSGVAVATDPTHGDVVLAEYTQPFNENDATYYHPLYERAVAVLGRRPPNVTADAAFDAWHIYETCADGDGIAAIPLNLRGRPAPQRTTDGAPLCPIGLPMHPAAVFAHTKGYRAQTFRCPLLHPQPTAHTCDHPQFVKGPGCVKYINVERGGLARVHLDRDAPAYKDIYRQRSTAERINSQAKALGIEHPKVRNHRSVHTLNTLTYIVINVHALQRVAEATASAPLAPLVLC